MSDWSEHNENPWRDERDIRDRIQQERRVGGFFLWTTEWWQDGSLEETLAPLLARLPSPPIRAYSTEEWTTAFRRDWGLAAPQLVEMSRGDAFEHLTNALGVDLAYRKRVLSPDIAESLSLEVVDLVSHPWRWWTNTEQGDWSSFTDATFDTGIVVIGSRRLAVAWIMDED